MTKHYQVANLFFTISGNGGYYNALTEYFSDKEIEDSQTRSMLDIIVSDNEDEGYSPDYFSLAGSVSFNKTSFRVKKKRFSYIVSDLFDVEKTTRVVLIPKKFSKLFQGAMALGGGVVGEHSKYGVFTHDVANYSCLWYIFAMTLMKYDQLFIHCGMMSKEADNEGIILTGTGGCGKTSIMMELITNSGYRYMAEDFGIVDKSGDLYDMQKKAAIYQTDVKWGNRYLKKAVSNLPFTQRLEWGLKKAAHRNPVHFFKPIEIFGNEVQNHSKLKKIFYLKRAQKGTEIQCRTLTSEQVAERAKTASFRELKELYEILGNIRAVGGDKYYDSYPSLFTIERKYKEILLSSLNGVDCKELEVPLNVKPKDTVKYIVFYGPHNVTTGAHTDTLV